MNKYLLALPLLVSGFLFGNESVANELAEEATPPPMEMKDVNFAKLSETFGHMMGKYIEALDFEVQLAKVFHGIELALNGKEPPMSEAECYQAITVIQEHNHKENAKTNLVKAEEFLKENSKKKDVVKLEDNKLQYKVTQKGTGDVVQADNSPKIRYKGTFLDGTVFGESYDEEHIFLGEIIEGLAKGVVGMKEGEKRTLYIHPELAFKDKPGSFPPNSLLTFEIELVKAHEPIEKPEDFSVDSDALPETTDELASTDEIDAQNVAR